MFEDGQIKALPVFDLTVPKENFGDFSTNVALAIAREGKFLPNDVADIIAREVQQNDDRKAIGEIKVVNGFINIFIAHNAVEQKVFEMQKSVQAEQIGANDTGGKQKIVFEYSSPNTNKPLHIGHTRNDVYGMACINLLRATGHEVIACEVINDRGIHIMKSMLMYMKFGKGETPQSAGMKPDHFVGKFYQMFEKENGGHAAGHEVDPAKQGEQQTPLEKEAQELLQRWENNDSEVRTLWRKMNDWFYEGVKQTYAREGSEFDEVQHESEIYDKGRELVALGLDKGVFHKERDGAVYVDLTEQGLDKKYLLRADGTTIYITQDIYLWHLRNEKYHPDAAVVTTSSEQAYHFQVLGKIFELLEFPWAQNFRHLPYEHVYLGKSKMSSRGGNVVSADDLLEMTKEKVLSTMQSSQKVKASADDKALVEAIAFGAIKYGYLKYDRNTKIYFDLDETIAIEGNTGPYLQYTNARIKSIMQKAGEFKRALPENLTEQSEMLLARHLLHYDHTVAAAAREYRPNLLCNYLLELAQKFNLFYDQVSVLNAGSAKQKQARLNLLVSVSNVFENGLELLGIKAPEKM